MEEKLSPMDEGSIPIWPCMHGVLVKHKAGFKLGLQALGPETIKGVYGLSTTEKNYYLWSVFIVS